MSAIFGLQWLYFKMGHFLWARFYKISVLSRFGAIRVNFWRVMASCEKYFQKIMKTRRNGSAAHVFNLENNDSRSIIRQIIQKDSLEKFIRFYLFIFLKIKKIYYYVIIAGYVTRYTN